MQHAILLTVKTKKGDFPRFYGTDHLTKSQTAPFSRSFSGPRAPPEASCELDLIKGEDHELQDLRAHPSRSKMGSERSKCAHLRTCGGARGGMSAEAARMLETHRHMPRGGRGAGTSRPGVEDHDSKKITFFLLVARDHVAFTLERGSVSAQVPIGLYGTIPAINSSCTRRASNVPAECPPRMPVDRFKVNNQRSIVKKL